MKQLIQQKELFEWSGYKRQGDLENFLKSEGIQYFRGRGGRLLTTPGLINAAKIGKAAHDQFEFNFDGGE